MGGAQSTDRGDSGGVGIEAADHEFHLGQAGAAVLGERGCPDALCDEIMRWGKVGTFGARGAARESIGRRADPAAVCAAAHACFNLVAESFR
jgi:hypothetical protein